MDKIIMFPEMKIDKNSSLPAYRQIMNAIINSVKDGELEEGEKLPAERLLAQLLDVSRGTIKKAYVELKRSNIIEIIQGKGCFVSQKHQQITGNRNERALMLIDELLISLRNMKFSYGEIRNLIDLKIIEREERFNNIHIAAVDCNPEALKIYQKQLGFISKIPIKKVLLNELNNDPTPFKKMQNFDLIISPSTHFNEIRNLLTDMQDKIVQVIVSPGDNLIVKLLEVRKNQKIGIFCESDIFYKIVLKKLKDLKLLEENINYFNINNTKDFETFISSMDVIILPPGYSLPTSRDNIALVQSFTQKGGKIIEFDYKIEQGSLIYLEERIMSLLDRWEK